MKILLNKIKNQIKQNITGGNMKRAFNGFILTLKNRKRIGSYNLITYENKYLKGVTVNCRTKNINIDIDFHKNNISEIVFYNLPQSVKNTVIKNFKNAY